MKMAQLHLDKNQFLSLIAILFLSYSTNAQVTRQRISINYDWRFMGYVAEPDKLIYDVHHAVNNRNDNVVADIKPTGSVKVNSEDNGLKKWTLPSANDVMNDQRQHHHVFRSGDEAELFLNGRSLGKKKKAEFDYRLRWGWAQQSVRTTDKPAQLSMPIPGYCRQL